MKLPPIAFAFLFLLNGISFGQFGKPKPPFTVVLAENDGIKVTMLVEPGHPGRRVLSDSCTVTILHPDGTKKVLPEVRIHSPDYKNTKAVIDPRKNGNVAVLLKPHQPNHLIIARKNEEKLASIEILRTDLIDQKPKIENFRMTDLMWANDQLVCFGRFREENSQSGTPYYPFVSRMKVTDEGKPSNHQILWTTWTTESKGRRGPDHYIHAAANPAKNSWIFHEKTLVWRNFGHPFDEDFPNHEKFAFLEDSSWLATNLESGQTEKLKFPVAPKLEESIKRQTKQMIQDYQALQESGEYYKKYYVEFMLETLAKEQGNPPQ